MNFPLHIFNDAVMYRGIFAAVGNRPFDEHGYYAKLAQLGIAGADAVELNRIVEEAIEENKKRKEFVCSYMHHSGAKYGLLTNKQMWWVYLKGDGYGHRTARELKEINGGWDWSHIRDSTIDGWKRMERELRKHI